MVHQGAQRLGEIDCSAAWSMFFRGASGARSDASSQRLNTPVIARSPDGLIVGSLDAPATGGLLDRYSDAAGFALRRRLADAVLELDRRHRIMVTSGHDLRQPLQVLTMILERLATTPGDRLDLLEVARSEIGRLSEGLGGLARAAFDAESAAPDLRPFAVAQAMEATIGRWSHHIRAGRTCFRYVHSRASVVSDPALVATILDNLLGNALKHASGGRVLFGCRRSGGRVAIEVLDSGPGMAEWRLEAWRRGRASSSSGGLGLGLYIVRRTVELLGLDLLVASEPGRGSRFAVYLPAA